MATTTKQVGKVRHILKGTWDASVDYDIMDVVIDPDSGQAYESLKSVPVGTPLTNESYWMKLVSITPLEITEEELESIFEQAEW